MTSSPIPPPSSAVYAQPRPPRPPLPPRHRRITLITGAFSYLFIQVGWSAFAAAVVYTTLAALSGFLAFGIGLMGVADTSDDTAGASRLVGELGGALLPRMAAAVALGAAAMVVLVAIGILLSGLILRTAGVHRPWKVTWAGAGVATALGGAVSGIAWSAISPIVAVVGGSPAVDPMPVLVGVAAVSCVIALAVGAVAWRWMAAALRAPAP